MNISDFDPNKVGEAEVDWWIAHNDHDKEKMVALLIKEHQELYGFSEEEARTAIESFVGAAKYHDGRELEKAINFVTDYYQAIKNKTGLDFNPKKAAELELNWWGIHDALELEKDKTPLAEAFAELYGEEFDINPEKLIKAGQLKAKATREHDFAEAKETPDDERELHWQKTKELLINFYQELKKVIKEN